MNNSNNKFDCIIVGGGLIGLLSAYLIAKQGRSVALLECGEIGRESSWAGGGILSPLYPWRYPDAVNELITWSRQHWDNFILQLQSESDIDPQSIKSGMLILDHEEQAVASEWAKRFNVTMECIDQEQLKRKEPALGPEPEHALWLPDVGQVRNPRLLKSLRQAATHAGVALFEQHPATQLLTQQGKITGVICEQQRFYAPQVVVAAGAWSTKLLATVDYQLPIEPVRGQMIQFQADPSLLSHITLHQGRYVIPRRDGQILAGSTLEYSGFDKSTDPQTRESLILAATQLVPALADCEVLTHWAGLRPGSPEGIPTIGELKHIPGLFINSGHFRNGVALSLASCQLLCNQVLNQSTIIPSHPYAPR